MLLYIHIPFCASKCGYCGFNSLTNMLNFKQKYLDCLCEDLENEMDLWDNLSLGMQFRTCENFGDFADSKSSLNPQNFHKYKSHTANTSIVDSANLESKINPSLRENERKRIFVAIQITRI